MKKPVTKLISIKLYDGRGHGGNVNRMFEGCMITLAVDNPEEVAVQMHGMVHHGAVDHDKSGDLSLVDKD